MVNGTDLATGLPQFYKRILTMSLQVPLSQHGDENKVDFFRTAVISHSWAHESLSRIAIIGVTF